MKKFAYSLERVRQWRVEQVAVEKLALERLHEERRGVQVKIEDSEREKAANEMAVIGGASVAALDLHSLDRFRRHVQHLQIQLHRELAGCDERVEAQRSRLLEAQRNAQLLEKVKARKLKAWDTALAKETDQQAAESHLAKWTSER